jgi:hypothetical protein
MTTQTRRRIPKKISNLLMLGVAALGIASILATTNPAAPSTSGSSNGYYYANWNCNNVGGCISDMGHNLGSAGPFCTSTSCNTWRQTYITSATCDLDAKNPIYNSPSSGCA